MQPEDQPTSARIPERSSEAAILVGLIIIVVLLVLTVRRTRGSFSRPGEVGGPVIGSCRTMESVCGESRRYGGRL
jgi:hypothetical protein